MNQIHVNTSKPYDILVGSGHIKTLATEILARKKMCTIGLITDTNVSKLYQKQVEDILEQEGFAVHTYVFEAGEQSKTMELVGNIVEFLAEQEITRTDLIVALGGGVVGDIAGFVSAIYLRGIDFVQVPTTLLACVDSSVGGKTGADLKAGKNLVGAFHQPILVLCDANMLDTLPNEIFAEGVAEMLKYGVLGDIDLFSALEGGLKRTELEEQIVTCVSMKRDIVVEDEFDNGKRQLLNLGHTFGHSIEQLSNFSLPHGHAVAIGMYLVAKMAEDRGVARCGLADDIKKALEKNNLPTETTYTAKQIAQGTMKDKKRRGKTISLILPEEIGRCRIEVVSVEEVEQMVEKAMER